MCGAVTSCNTVVVLSDQGMGGEIKVKGFVVTGDSLVVVTCVCLHVLELAHFCSRLERSQSLASHQEGGMVLRGPGCLPVPW